MKPRELVRGTGHGGVTGEDLATAIPAALEVNIREALDALEAETSCRGGGYYDVGGATIP